MPKDGSPIINNPFESFRKNIPSLVDQLDKLNLLVHKYLLQST